jgi:hypothetical protein
LKTGVTITNKDKQNIPLYVYDVNGHEIIGKKSIHFRANPKGSQREINFTA